MVTPVDHNIDEIETMTNIINLSPEILHNLFCFVDAITLSNLSKTCHQLRDFIDRDDLLWRRVYTIRFDEPRQAPKSWKKALQNMIRMEKIFNSKDYDLKRDETQFLGTNILPLLLSTTTVNPSRNIQFLNDHFHHDSRQSNASTLLRQSSLFRRCGLPFDEAAPSVYLRQLSARLHVYSSLSLEMRPSELLDVDGALEIHPFARSRVYDLRRYRATNFWGPFMNDGSGRIDWEKVQSIFIVLGYGLRMINERSGRNMFPNFGLGADDNMWCGLAANSYSSVKNTERVRDEDTRSNAATAGSMAGDSEDVEDLTAVETLEQFMEHYQDPREAKFQYEQAVFAAQDPYGVKGKWMRIVNFLDYHDLFAFNFTGSMPSEGIEREPVTTAEAFRLILLALWVTKIEWPDEDEGQPEDWETIDGSPTTLSPTESRSISQDPAPSNGTVPDDLNDEIPISTLPTDATRHVRPNGEKVIENDQEQSTPEPQRWYGTSSNDSTKEEREPTPVPKKKSKYPIVHFEGRSRSLHIRWDPNANSHIRGSNPFYEITGYVRAYPAPKAPAHEYLPDPTPDLSHIYPNLHNTHKEPSPPPVPDTTSEDDLVIRWTTFSVFHGEERWRSEGVQIGGLKSARGILGNWFDKDYDPHGPAGPTGFWKLDDGVERFGRGAGRASGWDEEEGSD